MGFIPAARLFFARHFDGGRWISMGGTLNLDEGTLTIDGGTRPPAPLLQFKYWVSYSYANRTVQFNRSHAPLLKLKTGCYYCLSTFSALLARTIRFLNLKNRMTVPVVKTLNSIVSVCDSVDTSLACFLHCVQSWTLRFVWLFNSNEKKMLLKFY